MKKLIKDAYKYSVGKMKDKNLTIKGKTITKSISPSKRKKKK